MRGQAFVAAAALAAALIGTAQPAAAQYRSYHDEHVSVQQQCQRARNNNTVAGAAIGSVAGAVLGSQAGARGHRSDGGVLGAVLGAAAGAAIARSNTQCDEVRGSYDPYYGEAYPRDYGYNQYPDDDYGLEGGPYRQSGYQGRYEDCRMGQVITRDPYGREYRENVEMCRGADGVWRPRA